MKDRERLALISTVYGTVVKNTTTFHGRVGGDLSYLLGAIAETLPACSPGPLPSRCQFSKSAGIVRILRCNFSPDHKVWSFIEIV